MAGAPQGARRRCSRPVHAGTPLADPTAVLAAALLLTLVAAEGRLLPFAIEAAPLLGAPTGEMGARVDGVGVGVGWGLVYHLPAAAAFGIDGSWLRYGSHSDQRPLVVLLDEGPATIGKVNVERRTDLLMAHLFLRLQPRWRPVRPFLEGLIGIKHFSASTEVGGDGWLQALAEERERRSGIEMDQGGGTAWSAGVGAGLAFAMRGEGFWSVGVRWLAGGTADYFHLGPAMAGRSPFVAARSRTSLVVISLGIGGRAREPAPP